MPVLRYLSFMVASSRVPSNPPNKSGTAEGGFETRPYNNRSRVTKLAPPATQGLSRAMTWSIIARDERTGRLGIAVATRFFAVGALVPHIVSGVGAVATQALVNLLYGTDGLHLLRAGAPVDEVIARLVANDAGRDHRQVHVMDASGHSAAHTGPACVGWCGHRAGGNFSLAGNMLAGPRVLEDTAAAYVANNSLPFARRLISAMRAGEAAGGDKRGKQSAALLIHGEEEWAELDLRVWKP